MFSRALRQSRIYGYARQVVRRRTGEKEPPKIMHNCRFHEASVSYEGTYVDI